MSRISFSVFFAHLFSWLVILHLLPSHVTPEASLDLSGSLVGGRVVQWDIHDVLVLWLSAALLEGRKQCEGGHVGYE